LFIINFFGRLTRASSLIIISLPNNIYFKITIIILHILISVLVKYFIEMTTVFLETLRPILILSKFIGLIDISYTLEPTGLLVRNINSAFAAILEIVRMIVLLLLTYLYWQQFYPENHVLQVIDTIKFWIIIIAARLSTVWTIRYLSIYFKYFKEFSVTCLKTYLTF